MAHFWSNDHQGILGRLVHLACRIPWIHVAAVGFGIGLLLAVSTQRSDAAEAFEYFDIDACVQDAADRYHVAPELIWRVIRMESDGNAAAINWRGRGWENLTMDEAQERLDRAIREDVSADVGLMQINIYHLRRSIDISRSDLRRLLDPCYNVMMGTYILAHRFHHLGQTWEAVASYHVGISGIRGARGRKLVDRGWDYVRRLSRRSGKPFAVWAHVKREKAMDMAMNANTGRK